MRLKSMAVSGVAALVALASTAAAASAVTVSPAGPFTATQSAADGSVTFVSDVGTSLTCEGPNSYSSSVTSGGALGAGTLTFSDCEASTFGGIPATVGGISGGPATTSGGSITYGGGGNANPVTLTGVSARVVIDVPLLPDCTFNVTGTARGLHSNATDRVTFADTSQGMTISNVAGTCTSGLAGPVVEFRTNGLGYLVTPNITVSP